MTFTFHPFSVYQRASSNIAIELPYKEWMRRLLIGPKGQNLQVQFFYNLFCFISFFLLKAQSNRKL